MLDLAVVDPRLLQSSLQQQAIGVVDLARGQWSAGCAEFIAGGEYSHAWLAVTRQLSVTSTGQQPHMNGPQSRASGHQDFIPEVHLASGQHMSR